MPIPVSIPTPLRPLTDNLDTVEVEGASVGELLSTLDKKYPGIGERLLDAQGNVRRFVNIYVNGEDIRFLQDKETPVKQGDEVSIVPAIAGGMNPVDVYKFTPYFENEVLRKRPYLRKEWCIQILEAPVREERQADSRLRFWGSIAEAEGRYLRVVTLEDHVTIHNAFFDR